VLLVVSWQVVSRFQEDPEGTGVPAFAGQWFWGGWSRFDAGWYLSIAGNGYVHPPEGQSPVAFFPAYPTVVRGVGNLIDNMSLAGILVTIACGLAASLLFWRWCRDRLPATAAFVAVAALLVYPYGWYLYGAVYADALFLASALAAFVLLERDRPLLAGLAGALASAARPVGLAVTAGLVVCALERRGALQGRWRLGLPRRIDLRRVRLRDTGVLVSIAGLAGYCIYLWHRFGDPFLFSTVQQYWEQPAGPRTWLKLYLGGQILWGDDRVMVYGHVAQAILTVAFFVAIPFVGRRFGWGYATYVFVLVAIAAVGSKDFQGLGRYLIAAFPVFALAGEWLAERPGLQRVALACSMAVLVVLAGGFAHGTYLA
jgi:hypothetical protein